MQLAQIEIGTGAVRHHFILAVMVLAGLLFIIAPLTPGSRREAAGWFRLVVFLTGLLIETYVACSRYRDFLRLTHHAQSWRLSWLCTIVAGTVVGMLIVNFIYQIDYILKKRRARLEEKRAQRAAEDI
jgi:hypothetical protein